MKRLTYFTVLLALVATAHAAESANNIVLRVTHSYPNGGGYNEQWGGSGTPEEIVFEKQRVLSKGAGGTYCCGFTFAVAMKAGGEMELFKGKTIEQIKRFQKEWYGAVEEPEIREKQCSLAVEHLGVGKSIPFDEAQPGDFCQLWRGKSGHSVIFLGWEMRDGKRVGLKYRSSQGSTKGIGDRSEFFSDSGIKGAEVDRKRVYFGRFERAAR